MASPEEAAAVAEDCEVIISTGPAGVEIPPGGNPSQIGEVHGRSRHERFPADGIGEKSGNMTKKEVEGILTIGVLAIGHLRNKIEARMLKTAMESEGAFLDYTNAFEFARELIGR